MKRTTVRSGSDQETRETGEKLGKGLKNGLLCLYGELGAGKTTFVKGLAAGLGVRGKIQSPTYTYQRIHRGKIKLYHFDCYRLTKPDALMIQEIEEAIAADDGVVAIEWAERIEEALPARRMNVRIEHDGENSRIIKVRAYE